MFKSKYNYLTGLFVISSTGIFFLFLGVDFAINIFSSPEVIKVKLDKKNDTVSVKSPIIVSFNHPVKFQNLRYQINPDIEGKWVSSKEDNLVFERTLTFIPSKTLESDTTYSIKLANIEPLSGLQEPTTYTFSFRTHKIPSVAEKQNLSIGPFDNFVVNLDAANDDLAEFNFIIDPLVKFRKKLSTDKKQYLLSPEQPLKQGVNYYLTITKKPLTIDLTTNKAKGKDFIVYDRKTNQVLGVLDQNESETTLTYLVLPQPSVISISSIGTNASTGPVSVVFDKEMNKESVAKLLKIEPPIEYSLNWQDSKTINIIPSKNLSYNTSYKITFGKGTNAKDGTFFENDFVNQFTTVGNVKVSQFTPSRGSKNVAISSKVYVTFDQAVDKLSAQNRFTISPYVAGSFSWNQNQMLFVPSTNFNHSTTYQITVKPGVKSLSALDSIIEFSSKFTTADLYESIKLNVPIFKQKYTLSCEFANMRMALAYKGLGVSEDQLISETTFDNTPHVNNVWGDPSVGFVGNFNGSYFGDGYGAYYPVIVNTLSRYREVSPYVGWSLTDLLNEVKSGNPVIVWSCLVCHKPVYWNTPENKQIYAYEYYHMMIVVGYNGTTTNPQSIIVNDSYSGRQLSYSKSQFSSRWAILNNTAVVVR